MAEPTTFRDRLALQTTLLCLLVLTAGGTAVFFGARAALLANLDGALLGIARAELASALDGPGGKVHLHEENQLVLHGAAGYEKYALIRNAQGDPAAYTANLKLDQLAVLDTPPGPTAQAGRATYSDIVLRGQRLRAIHYPFQDQKGTAYLATCAVPYAPLEQALQLLGAILMLALTVCGVGALWGAQRLARRLTDPLAELARQARHIGEDSLDARIPRLSSDQELESVREGLNAMLARLETAFSERERVLEAQRQFLLDASHELRTPVSNLRGTLEVALRRPRSADDYHETLEQCLPEAERLSVLVQDLLALARADSHAEHLERKPIAICALVEQALQAHRARATEKSVQLCQVAESDLRELSIWGDAVRLRQVLDNLLDNALRLSPPGTTITITVTKTPDATVMMVQDQGPGIAPDDLPFLFERFWRADLSRARATGGLGLGLAIARSLVEAQGGTLQALPTDGEGACFELRFPHATASEAAEPG